MEMFVFLIQWYSSYILLILSFERKITRTDSISIIDVTYQFDFLSILLRYYKFDAFKPVNPFVWYIFFVVIFSRKTSGGRLRAVSFDKPPFTVLKAAFKSSTERQQHRVIYSGCQVSMIAERLQSSNISLIWDEPIDGWDQGSMWRQKTGIDPSSVFSSELKMDGENVLWSPEVAEKLRPVDEEDRSRRCGNIYGSDLSLRRRGPG